jgi:hypothetical protein
MPYVSAFEVISEFVVPPALLPPGAVVPFALKGYFVHVSRLAGDGHAGDLHVRLTYHPSVPFPPAANILVDAQTAGGGTTVLALGPANDVEVVIPPGKSVLVGVQPNFTNTSPTGPLVNTFGVRGYVTLEPVAPSPKGFYKLGVSPESRAIFCTLEFAGGHPVADFSDASDIAYALPTPQTLLVVEH